MNQEEGKQTEEVFTHAQKTIEKYRHMEKTLRKTKEQIKEISDRLGDLAEKARHDPKIAKYLTELESKLVSPDASGQSWIGRMENLVSQINERKGKLSFSRGISSVNGDGGGKTKYKNFI